MVPLLRSRSDNPHATLVTVVARAVRVTELISRFSPLEQLRHLTLTAEQQISRGVDDNGEVNAAGWLAAEIQMLNPSSPSVSQEAVWSLRRLLTAEWQAINNGEIQAPGFDIASEPVQFVWTFSVLEFATLSNTHAIQLGLEAFNYVWASRPTTCSLFLFLNDFRTPKPSLSPRRRRSATKFVWVVSGARSSDLPQHAVRVFLSLQVLNRRSIVSLPAATADDAEDDVSEISWKTPIFGASNIFATHYKSICSVIRHNDLALA
ncbi:hypothetical protein GQ607_007730 [Colletotrichum asianum]|uniref:Uncharacterized protein n=1 Tax=Colletotrichum asianum TaxID=702518 RepID=A0A8H3WDZ0_9PEZI|nr:hypothetical protein GQ607_007730 [Colletotrichum asianum]